MSSSVDTERQSNRAQSHSQFRRIGIWTQKYDIMAHILPHYIVEMTWEPLKDSKQKSDMVRGQKFPLAAAVDERLQDTEDRSRETAKGWGDGGWKRMVVVDWRGAAVIWGALSIHSLVHSFTHSLGVPFVPFTEAVPFSPVWGSVLGAKNWVGSREAQATPSWAPHLTRNETRNKQVCAYTFWRRSSGSMEQMSKEWIHCVSKLSSINTWLWEPSSRAPHSGDSMSDLKARKGVIKHLGKVAEQPENTWYSTCAPKDIAGGSGEEVGTKGWGQGRRASDECSSWVCFFIYQTLFCSMLPHFPRKPYVLLQVQAWTPHQ